MSCCEPAKLWNHIFHSTIQATEIHNECVSTKHVQVGILVLGWPACSTTRANFRIHALLAAPPIPSLLMNAANAQETKATNRGSRWLSNFALIRMGEQKFHCKTALALATTIVVLIRNRRSFVITYGIAHILALSSKLWEIQRVKCLRSQIWSTKLFYCRCICYIDVLLRLLRQDEVGKPQGYLSTPRYRRLLRNHNSICQCVFADSCASLDKQWFGNGSCS